MSTHSRRLTIIPGSMSSSWACSSSWVGGLYIQAERLSLENLQLPPLCVGPSTSLSLPLLSHLWAPFPFKFPCIHGLPQEIRPPLFCGFFLSAGPVCGCCHMLYMLCISRQSGQGQGHSWVTVRLRLGLGLQSHHKKARCTLAWCNEWFAPLYALVVQLWTVYWKSNSPV